MSDATRRGLAEIGRELGDERGTLFSTALRALASHGEAPRSDEGVGFAAAQVYAEATAGEPADAERFVTTLLDYLEIEGLSDVDDALGREAFERRGYKGALAVVEA